MFKALGILIALYVACSAVSGSVYAKSGVRGRVVARDESPVYFWIVLACYAALGIALLTIF